MVRSGTGAPDSGDYEGGDEDIPVDGVDASAYSGPTIIRVPRINVTKSTNIEQARKKAEASVAKAFEQIIASCIKNSNQKWCDPDFGPNRSDEHGAESFWLDGKIPRKNYPDPTQCDWSRPRYDADNNTDVDDFDDFGDVDAVCTAGRLFVDGASAGDAAQGTLGDCWLIGALSVLAGREDLTRAMFWGCDDMRIMSLMQKYGIYICRFMKDFEWYYVITDDRLPVYANGKLCFAKCRDPNELWVPFAEKAYAKLHGNYGALIGGYIDEGLRDLTGLISEQVVIRKGHRGYHSSIESALQSIDNHPPALWQKLDRYLNDWGCMMGCSIQPDPVRRGDKALPGAKAVEKEVGNSGLRMKHAYALIDVGEVSVGGGKHVKLLRIRNPWGFGEWNGAWSDTSSEFKRYQKQIRRVFDGPIRRPKKGQRTSAEDLDVEKVVMDENDGTFFMCWEDWIKYFTVIFAAVDFPDEWSGQRVSGSWSEETSGGNNTMKTWG